MDEMFLQKTLFWLGVPKFQGSGVCSAVEEKIPFVSPSRIERMTTAQRCAKREIARQSRVRVTAPLASARKRNSLRHRCFANPHLGRLSHTLTKRQKWIRAVGHDKFVKIRVGTVESSCAPQERAGYHSFLLMSFFLGLAWPSSMDSRSRTVQANSLAPS